MDKSSGAAFLVSALHVVTAAVAADMHWSAKADSAFQLLCPRLPLVQVPH